MGSSIRIGIIGCGHIAWRHIRCLKEIGGNRICAIADPNPAMMQERAQEIGGEVACYEDPLALARDAAVDALYLCVPPFAHGEMERIAAARRLPLFIEKPVAPSLATARTIAAILPEDLIVSVAYNWRYIPNVAQLQALCMARTPIAFRAEWKEQMPGAPWWRTMKQSGGPLIEQASHLLDLGLHLLGPVAKVRAAVAKNDRPSDDGDIPDSVMALFEYACGTVGEMLHTCLLNQVRHRIGVELLFPGLEARLDRDGTLRMIGPAGETISGANSDRLLCNVDSYLEESRVFLDAVRTGNPQKIQCTYRDAMAVIALAEAIYESARTGRETIPEPV
jgi:predicted dehydrogenase